ncbi:hypothetical protein QSJ19_01460 [Gordonia sp. ABSL11-1]|uniref:hypothetical protein n=1 Tax=Gordonia sp. ABSL11-1 TaxID=3053924 RepID=UPI0025744358|nr:hypothetical protein [Gordonia sp. ABSL11-1]MDL9944270.1 hypothetical protein [Gordonia sp. ABSL11-1]
MFTVDTPVTHQPAHVPNLNDWKETGSKIRASRSTVFSLWHSGVLGSLKVGKRRFSTDQQIAEFIDRQSMGGAA